MDLIEKKETKFLDINEKQDVTYCIPIWLRDEQVKLSSARIKDRVEAVFETKEDPIAIVCYGPSLNDTWEKIRDFKYIMTCSGSHKFLLERGIVPTWHVDLDPRPHKVQLLGQPHKDVKYLIASTCHPNMFDALEGFNVKLWHIYPTEDEAFLMLPPGEWSLLGGGSVGLRALCMARFLGFTNHHIFGMDGCEGESGKHADFHPNQAKGNYPTIYKDKIYYTTPSILECAKQTFHELDELKDVNPIFYGEGLVQEMAKDYKRKELKDRIIAVRKPELISKEYKELNRQLHETNLFYGVGGGRYANAVLEMYESIGAKSILDYGCGKGYLGKALPFPIWEYDPAIKGKDESPRPADLVTCFDVLEHIEPDKLDKVLLDIHRCTNKIAYFSINTKASSKTLADGRNTHLIQENSDWWIKKLSEFFTIGEPIIEENYVDFAASPKKIKYIEEKETI